MNRQFEARLYFPNVVTEEGEALRSLAVAIYRVYLKYAGSDVDFEVEETPLGPAAATLLDSEIHRVVEEAVVDRDKGEQIFSAELFYYKKGKQIDPMKPTWAVDPLDGSAILAKGRPYGFCTSIAFVEDGRVKAGLILDPFTLSFPTSSIGRVWFAEKGKGAFLNGQRLHPRKDNVSFEDATLAMQRVRTPDIPETLRLDRFWDELWTRRHTYTVSTSQILAYVEAITGELDGAVAHRGAQPWDIAAALLLAHETGGIKMTDLLGAELYPLERPNGVVLAPEKIHSRIVELASQAFLA